MVAVVGPADAPEPLCAAARQVGFLLAQRGITVVTGGLGGVMAAAAEGVREGGGLAIGLLPGTDRDAGNPHLGVVIPTGLGQARNALVVGSANAVIAVGGSWGTLSEVALARRAGTPVVWLAGWTIHDTAGEQVTVLTAASPEQAVGLVT